MSVVASAPGKVVILGEYAVLEGAPAVVMAVDRRAQVKITENNMPFHRISSLNWGSQKSEFTINWQGEMKWNVRHLRTKRKYNLVEHVVTNLVADNLISSGDLPSVDITLDTRTFYHSAQKKLGIGSSAALLVALASALTATAQKTVTFEQLLAMHKAFQGGRGSGLDVATSFHGGVISYQNGKATQLSWPDLPQLVVFTGQSASTKDYIQRFKAAIGQDTTIIKEMHTTVTAAIEAVAIGNQSGLLECIKNYGQLLQSLGKQCKINILTEAHAAIAQLATKEGVVYKTCGAGGGDIGMVFANDNDRLAYFAQQLRNCGLVPLTMTKSPQGLELA